MWIDWLVNGWTLAYLNVMTFVALGVTLMLSLIYLKLRQLDQTKKQVNKTGKCLKG